MSDWHTFDHTDPSTLPTKADASEDRTVWVRRRNGTIISVEYDVIGFRQYRNDEWAFVAWHPKPEQSPPPYTPPEPDMEFALRLFIDNKRVMSHEITREQAVTFIHTAEHLITYLRDAYDTPQPEPPEPKRRKHCGRVAFISDSGSQLAMDGSWAEVLPGDIDPDAALRLRDASEKVIKMHDSGVLERQPHDSRSIDELRAAVGECRR